MSDLTPLYSALQQADAAGDTASAQQLSDYIRSQSAPSTPATADAQPQDYPGRSVALAGRAIGEGVTSALLAPETISTAFGNLENKGINAVLGTHEPTDTKSLYQNFSDWLTSQGAPTPQTSGENLTGAGVRGLSSALTGVGVLGAAQSIPNLIRAGLSGTASATASEGARQAGLPSWAQLGVGAAAGLTPAFAESSASTIAGLARPLLSSGQSQIAGNLLNDRASDPSTALANLQSSQPLVPGSLPTSGAASGDIGLLGLEKGVRGINATPFGERLSTQNTAQQSELGSMAGTPADLAAAIKARSAQTTPLYSAAATDSAPIDNEMVSLMQRPSMQAAIAKAKGLAEEKGQTFGMSSNSPGGPMSLSGSDLQGVKMALDDMQSTAFTQGIGSHQARAMQDTSDALKDWMLRNVPSQRAADAAFQSASGPINRMTTLQELQAKAGTSAVDPNTRLPFLSSAKFGNALQDVQSDARSGVSVSDMARLSAMQKDLQNQQMVNGPLLKAPGSDTFQNFATNQNLLGAGSIGGLATKPLGWLYQKFGVDSGVNEQLTKAMLDPKFAASLMSKAAIPKTQTNFAYNDLGSFFGLAGLH